MRQKGKHYRKQFFGQESCRTAIMRRIIKRFWEVRTMIMMMTVLFMMILVSVVRIGLRLAWNMTKFVFGLGLFWFCPLLFVLTVLLGGFHNMWLPILVIGLLFGGGFRRA